METEPKWLIWDLFLTRETCSELSTFEADFFLMFFKSHQAQEALLLLTTTH